MPVFDGKNLPEILTVSYTILTWIGRAIRAVVTLLHNDPQKFEVEIGPRAAETIEKVTAMITSQPHDVVPTNLGHTALILYMSDPDKMAEWVGLGLSDVDLGFRAVNKLPADVRNRINHLLAVAMESIGVEHSGRSPNDVGRVVDSDAVKDATETYLNKVIRAAWSRKKTH